MKKILIVLPIYNEEKILEQNTLKVFDFCQKKLNQYNWQILIADNGSTDGTLRIAEELSKNVYGTRPPTNYQFERITNKDIKADQPRAGEFNTNIQITNEDTEADQTQENKSKQITNEDTGADQPRDGEFNTNIQITNKDTRTDQTRKSEFNQITNKILYFHISEKGRGYALKKAWSNEFPADLYAYMDIDLSSDLNALPLLIEALENGYQLATGSRLKSGHQTKRSLPREILSRGYNFLLKSFFHPTFEDAQCGFKAITKEVAEKILPKVKNNNWFFDTEMFILAEKAGYKIKEIPIEWLETRAHNENYMLGRAHKQGLCALERQIKRKSTVKILATVWEDVKGMVNLSRRLKG